ncbi:hypothetical protein OAV36_04110 [Flavobacteriales bacterium]|jgi:hypothetical protein|nr:hypothetical protein [Flavobacteriales bacterium]MDG1348196.1 hypothetical protein [Flavobacteriales bacterium]|tara:strand:- start:1268 stop:1870 length:603 start_codon:yes stop_codon:yes gene_type:complete
MKLSKFISIVLHPIFMPLFAFYLTLKSNPSLGIIINPYLNYVYGVVISCTILLPLLTIFFLIKNGKVNSLEMSNHKERTLPLFRTVIWMCLGLYILNNILLYTPILKAEFIGAILIILLAAIISKFWKISLHLLGIGGVVGVFIALQIMFGGVLYMLLIFIVLSGILGVARIDQKAHNHAQIYIGFLLGVCIELITILVY